MSAILAPAVAAPPKSRNKFWLGFALLLPLALINLTAFVMPVLRLVEISFREGRPGGVLTELHTLQNYKNFLTDSHYLGLIPSSLGLSLAVTLTTLVFAYPIALFLFRAPQRWRNLLFVITVSPLLVSGVVRTYGWMVLLGDQGVVNGLLMSLGMIDSPLRLINNYFGVYIGLVEILMPYMALSLIAGFGRLDPAYEEAAASLGAGRIASFWRIVFPLTMPGVLLGCLLCFVLAISSFITPKLLGGGRVFLLATEIFYQAMVQLQWPLAATISVVILLIFSVALNGYSRLSRRAE